MTDASASSQHDLRSLVDSSGRFLTIAIPTPSGFDDAAHRFDVEWRNARRRVSDAWSADELAALDETVAALPHDVGAALVVVHAEGGATLVEFLEEPVHEAVTHEGPVPRLAPLIESRQRAIPHVVVETDRAGADFTAFDGGTVLATDSVDGETLHIHRGHPGGWSQRRFQQRAENTWERNGHAVGEAVADLAHRVDAQLIAVAGDVRAQGFVLEALPADLADRAVKIEAGSPDGVADEVVRLMADLAASRVTDLAERFRTARAAGRGAAGVDDVLTALAEGRVDTLLVHDDGADEPVIAPGSPLGPEGARVVDAAIVGAIRTEAEVVVVPRLAVLDGPVAAILRW